jgi:hypothetical protein
MPKFKTTIEVEVEVEYTVEPAQKGSCDSTGVPEEPSWDSYVNDDFEVTYPKFLDEETKRTLLDEADEDYRECLDEDKLQRQLQKKGDDYE